MSVAELVIGISYDKAVTELVDVVGHMSQIINLVPPWSATEAEQHKQNAVDIMLEWIDEAEEK